MTSKKIYQVTTAGLDVRDVRLIEIVFKHSQYNKYEFLLVPMTQLESADLLIANTVEPQGLEAISQLQRAHREIPVIAALPRGAVSSTRHAISIDRLTLQLLPILNRVIDLEFSPPQASATLPAKHVFTTQPEQRINTISKLAEAALPKSNLVVLPPALGLDGALTERLRVLIVDDSPTVRQQLAQAFNRMGIVSEVAASARQALDRLAVATFNLALVDVVMPEMDGYKLTRAIKRIKSCRQMPVIILTSKSSPFDLARGALAGCNTYLTKPVPLKDLEQAVIKQLRKSLAIDDISGLIRTSQATSAGSPATAQTSQALHLNRSMASSH